MIATEYVKSFNMKYQDLLYCESQGQEEAACMCVFWPIRDHFSELFTQMAALKFENAATSLYI